MRKRYYVGHRRTHEMELIYDDRPRMIYYPEYYALTGPFNTKAGALVMIRGGVHNPHTTTVIACERIARAERKAKQ